MNRNVVITGLGAVTPIGNTAPAFWQALIAGRSGIGPITRFDPSRIPTRIAGEVKNFKPEPFMDVKEARRSDLFVQYAAAAAQEAIQDAGLDKTPFEPDRVGAI